MDWLILWHLQFWQNKTHQFKCAPFQSFAVKRIAAAKCVVPEDEMLARCLNQIKNLLLLDLQGTEVGLTLCNLAGGLDESADVLQVLKDCFAKKATATILKRTSALWTLAGWMLDNEQTPVWDINESQLYSYMCYLRNHQAAPTKASHLVEALNFFDSKLRFRKTVCRTILSPRVQGAAHAMYLEKRKLKQAPQLTVAAVKALEIICTSNTNLLRSAISGALLFCIFAAARWSDFARLENLWADRSGDLVLVEAETSRHKTSKSKEAKTRLLPFTALGRFSLNESWGECFVSALNQIKDDTGLSFLPSWNDRSGTWSVSPMTTAEASLFLKEMLEPILGPEAVAQFSSHSCKPTILTWCGMTDILIREERTMLGHHIEPTTKSATTYNRDSQLLLQAKVSKVLDRIIPWADRSWRYQGVPFEPVDLQRAGWQWWRNIGRIRHRRHRSGFNTLEGPLGWQAVGASRRPRWVYVCGPQIDWNNSCAAGRRDGQVSLRTTKDSEHEASGTILYWCCDCPLLHPVQRRCQAPQRPGMSASEKPAAPMWSLGKGDMKGVQKSSNNNCLINQLYKNMESL